MTNAKISFSLQIGLSISLAPPFMTITSFFPRHLSSFSLEDTSWLAHAPLLTLCHRVGHLIKYPLVPGHLNTLNVQLHNVLLLTF